MQEPPYVPPEPGAPPEPPKPTEPTPRALALQTIREGVLLFFASVIVGGVLYAVGAKFLLPSTRQAQGMAQLANLSPLAIAFLVVVAAPVIEEALFRGVPWMVWRGLSFRANPSERIRYSWLFGVPAALLFAALHGLGENGGFATLPVPQLLVGLWSWHVLTVRGLQYSMLLHATHNFIPLVFVLLMRAGGVPMPQTP